MDAGRLTSQVAVAAILLVSIVGAPVMGSVELAGTASDTLGEGTATVDEVTFPGNELRITAGRFGTGVLYLRVPRVTVRIAEARGRSRLVYGVAVPALDFERVSTVQLSPGENTVRRLGMDARAFPREQVDRRQYRATVTVRVQSFSEDKRVFARNVTVEVSE